MTIYVPTARPALENNIIWGYVPQELIEWAAKNPQYLATYPALSSCYPGGPPIQLFAGAVLAVIADPCSYLTISTTSVVNSLGCFKPGSCRMLPAESPLSVATPTSPPRGPVETEAKITTQFAGTDHTTKLAFPLPAKPTPPNPASVQMTPVQTTADQAKPPGTMLDGPVVTSTTPDFVKPTTTSQGVATIIASAFSLENPVHITALQATTLGASPKLPSAVVDLSIITVGSSTMFANSASDFVIGGMTLVPGALAITVSATVISLPSSATAIVIDGTTNPIFPLAATGYIIDGKTLVPGAPAITVSDKTISLDSLGTAVVIDGSTMVGVSQTIAMPAPVLTVGTVVVTADTASRYIIDQQTLKPGESAVTISGSVVTFSAVPSHIMANPPVITVGTQLVTADTASHFVIGSQTIIPGETAITISGTPLPIVPLPRSPLIGAGTNASSASYPLQTFNSGGSEDRILAIQGVIAVVCIIGCLIL